MRELGAHTPEELKALLGEVRSLSMDLQNERAFRRGEFAQAREAIKTVELELASPL